MGGNLAILKVIYKTLSKVAALRRFQLKYSSVYIKRMSFSYNGTNLTDILQSGTDKTLTGYKINGTDMKFLTAFYKGTDKDTVKDLSANMSMFKISGEPPEICPKYTLYADTGTGFSVPSNVTKMFVVCIGGGGGGGGGGTMPPDDTGGGGGGGGGGALNSWFVNFVSGQTTYNVTIGAGGNYGQPNDSGSVGGMAEGQEDDAGNYAIGRDGSDGGDTTFRYNSVNYISAGGKGGKGGKGGNTSDATNSGTGSGGAGGVVSTTPTPLYASAGSNGVTGTYSNNNNYFKEPGKGGASGNKRGTGARFLINNSYVNVQPFTAYTNNNASYAGYNDFNNDRICYGDGGMGGVGEGGGWGSAGYYGLKGCVIVFFYY